MALLVAVLCGLMALANAGMIQMGGMQQQQQQQQMIPMGSGGCNNQQPGPNGEMPAGCEIPDMGNVNMEEYLEQQMQQQQYETQAMAERIRAQFEGMVKNVTMKKQRYAMTLVTEYVAFCTCGSSTNQVYNNLFIQNARNLNLTDSIEMTDSSKMPYQATNEEEARMLIFGGLVKAMCESASTFLAFADQVNQRIPAYTQGKK